MSEWKSGKCFIQTYKKIQYFDEFAHTHRERLQDQCYSVTCEPKHAVVYGLNYNICVSICVVNVFCFNAIVVSVMLLLLLLLTEYYHVHVLEQKNETHL